MDKTQKEELVQIAGAGIHFDEPMRGYTTYRIGGLADALCPVHEKETLQAVLRFLNRETIAYWVLGRGSNVLIRDEGLRGVVLMLKGRLAAVKRSAEEKNRLKAGGGLDLAELLLFCRQNGLAGLEFMAGVPGSVGGAAAMNAGAWNRSIGQAIRELGLVDRQGAWITKPAAECGFSYRQTDLPHGAVVAEVVLETACAEPEQVGAKMKDYLAKRKAGQPLDQLSAGSVFKNPAGDYAGRLIEEAGLKGHRIGDAVVSDKHANFIVNLGQATAKDVLALMNLIRERVESRHGIVLEPEIKVI